MKKDSLFKFFAWNASGNGVLYSIFLFFFFSVIAVFPVFCQNAHGQSVLSGKKKTTKSREITDLKTVIPWDEMTPDAADTVRKIIEAKTVFRRMPMQTNFCDKKLYQFLMQHPDVVVGMWELMDVTDISLHEVAPGEYKMQECTGSVGHVNIVFQDANLLIAYCDGSFVAPMNPKPILGETVLILHSRFGTDGDGRPAVQSRLDCYVKIHNPGAELLAKILVPVFGKVADANFEQVMGFVSSVSDVAEYDHESIQNIAGRLKTVRPAVAEEFAFVAEDVYERASERFLVASGETSILRETVPIRKKRNDDIREPEAPVPSEAPITVAVRAPFPGDDVSIKEESVREHNSSTPEKAPLPFPMITPGSRIPVETAPLSVAEEEKPASVIIQSVSANTSEFVNSVSRTPAAPTLGKPKNIRPDSTPTSSPQGQTTVQKSPSTSESHSQVRKPSGKLPPKPTRIPVPVIP